MMASSHARVRRPVGADQEIQTRRAPVRVMHVVYRLQAGGMELGVVKVVNGVDRRLVQSSVCSTTPATEVRHLLASDVRLFECRRRQGNDPRLVVELARLFRRERPHIVHTHSWGTLCEGVLAARLARVPAVIHGEHGTLQLGPVQRRVQRLVWGRVDRMLSVSSRLAARMCAETGFPEDRITTILNGVDTSRFGRIARDEARAVLGWNGAEMVIGTVGRLVPVKDHATLVEAAARLRDRGHDTRTVIAGEGPLRDDLRRLIDARKLADRVSLLGHRTDPEIVLGALDVFVLPSTSEGLSNTILEALASGLPVVATRVGGNVELVEEGRTGALVAPGDPDALAAALAGLLTSAERRTAMGAAARKRAHETFSLEAMIAQYEALYVETFRSVSPSGGNSA